MRIHPVQLDLPLSDDRLVDILLVQWRTPVEEEEGRTPPILSGSTALKQRVLESLCAWIHREHAEINRPLFVLTPEVSTPLSFLVQLEALLVSVNRPAVVIVGLEHLSPTEYGELILRSCNPARELWTQDIDRFQRVNAAAILTRSADGTQGLYVQPKIRPADSEQRELVYSSEHVLLFHHKSHGPGAGLNFCVQICSDFCNTAHVSLLREEIAAEFEKEDLRLDLTLLLQCNPVQNVPEFRDGSNAYFDVPDRKVSTEKGALVMINNASRQPRKSALWGRSQFRFPYKRWRTLGGEFTFWFEQESGERWQAATFREPGPSVYWLTYRPQYLSDPRPGSGDAQSQPFSAAFCWLIANSADQLPSFKAISAVMHWLEGEWTSGAATLLAWLAEQGIDPQIAVMLNNGYSETVDEWIVALTHDKAKGAVRALFACFEKGYPCRTSEFTDIEPRKWSENSARATTEMLRIHAMLRIGASRSGHGFRAAPLDWRHALLADTLSITYLWGAGAMSKHMAERYRDLLPLSIRASAQYVVVVLMNPKDHIPPDELVRHLSGAQIDRATSLPGAGSHLAGAGEVTTGERWNPIFLYDYLLENGLGESDAGAAERRLSEVVQEVMEHAAGA